MCFSKCEVSFKNASDIVNSSISMPSLDSRVFFFDSHRPFNEVLVAAAIISKVPVSKCSLWLVAASYFSISCQHVMHILH